MSPDRRGRNQYTGPERRSRHRRREDLPPVRHGWFTSWQWAVLGSFFCIIVVSLGLYGLAQRADQNARRGNAAICALVGTLESSLAQSERLMREDPTAPEMAARRRAAETTRRLIRDMRREVPNCKTALR